MHERELPAGDVKGRRFRIADLVVDPGQAAVLRDGERLSLPGLSYDLLLVLARAAPDLVTHDELMARVWKGVVVSPETIGQRVKLLRDALGDDPRTPKYVAVVRGRGYRLLPVPAAVPDATEPAPGPSGAPPPPGELSTSPSGESVPAPPGRPSSAPPGEPSLSRSRGAAHSSSGESSRQPSGEPGAVAEPVAASTGVTLPRSLVGPRPARAAVYAVLVVAAVGALVAYWPAWFGRTPTASTTDSAPVAARTSVEVVGAPPRSVAVLPFRNLSPDPANAFIGEGLAEIVLNRLAGTPSLFVVARSSSFAFARRAVEPREIARQLGVRYLVEGGVQRDRDRLRVTAQLVDAASGRPVKVLTYDRRIDDLFALQDELATQLAGALDVSLAAATAGTANLAAELEYLQGLAALGRWRVAECENAIRHFRAARELDPRFAHAYAGEAKARMRIAFLLGGQFRDAAAEARPLVERALALDPNLASAYVARATLASDRDAAERDLRRAIELAPSDAEGWFELGQLLDGAQPVAAVVELFERAIALDPLQPRYRYVHAITSQALDRDPAAFERRLREVLRIDPNYAQALSRLAQVVSVYRGDYAEAIVLAERALAADPRAGAPRAFALDFYLAVGDVAAAADLVRGHPFAAHYEVAFAFARGDDRAAEAIARRIFDAADAGRGPPPAAASIVSIVSLATALRNGAVRTGDYERAIRRLKQYLCDAEDRARDCVSFNSLATALTLAELEVAAGSRARGEDIARRLLALFDTNPGFTFPIREVCRSRMRLLLGDTEGALAALEDALRTGRVIAWWLLLEHDTGYDSLRAHPRFRTLVESSRRHAAEQRARLERLRADGHVPLRPHVRAP